LSKPYCSLVFRGQQYILMLQTFLENCFFIAKKFLFSTDPYIQTGGVYILYALYYKQPIKEWVKIRLTRAEADKMVEIVEVHKSYNSLDLVFIYHKMRKDGAFQYCALVQPVGLEARFLRRYDLSNEELQRTSSTNDPLRKFKELMEEDPDLVQLEETDEEYQKLVNKYKVKNEKLFVFPTQIGQELKRAYSNVFNIDLEDDEERARLKEVKSRAMSNMNATYRGEKAVLTAASLEAPSTSK
jgi:hypothetical protein